MTLYLFLTLQSDLLSLILWCNSVPEKEKSPSSDNDEAEMEDIHSISSEASLTDNIPNLVTNEHNVDKEEQKRKIENKSKDILENLGKITKQKYFDDRGKFYIMIKLWKI